MPVEFELEAYAEKELKMPPFTGPVARLSSKRSASLGSRLKLFTARPVFDGSRKTYVNPKV